MLNTIIAPVDFSKEADTALKFAAEICKRANANLIILHSLQGKENEKEVKLRLAHLESELHETFGSDLKCESVFVEGDFIAVLESQIESQRPDLIVMGTKGASGLKKIFIGSNTVKVIANTEVPVLVIPETARFEEFNRTGKNRVVFATDLEEVGNDAAFDVLAEIILLMVEPKLRILNVRPKNTMLSFHQNMERASLISRFRDEIETERITVFSSKVLEGINFYLDKHTDTGMIAMIARDSGGLFQHNFTQEMASITRYPLLVLRASPKAWLF